MKHFLENLVGFFVALFKLAGLFSDFGQERGNGGQVIFESFGFGLQSLHRIAVGIQLDLSGS